MAKQKLTPKEEQQVAAGCAIIVLLFLILALFFHKPTPTPTNSQPTHTTTMHDYLQQYDEQEAKTKAEEKADFGKLMEHAGLSKGNGD